MKLVTNKRIPIYLVFTVLAIFPIHAKQTDFRDLPSFSAVHSSGSVDVILEKGDSEKARVEAENIDVKKIITRVENGTLKIYLNDNRMFGTAGRKTVYVSYRNIRSIQSSGSGDIRCNSSIHANNIQISSTGSGDLKLKALMAENEIEVTSRGSGDVHLHEVKSAKFAGHLSGSGDMRIDEGSGAELSFSVSGSGDISAGNFRGEKVQARTSGSGDIKTYASKAIQVKISGSGDVVYYGNPSHKNVNKSGSGDARKL